jgi:myo-inositol-1(or 4)-monophosphatase
VSYDLEQIQKIIIPAAREELLPRFANVEREHKTDGSVVTEADHAVQQRIEPQLMQHWPDTVFIGEEMSPDDQAGLLASGRPTWCLDPLDGTSNFASGIPYFAVSLALLENGEVKLGIVYDPLRDEYFAAEAGSGVTLNGEPLRLGVTNLNLKQTIGLIDFKRLAPDLATRLATQIPYASQRSFGSVALDWCWLAAGRGHLYLHGRSQLWDYAAGTLIFESAGGHACTLDGEPIFSNSLAPRSSVAAVDSSLFSAWTAWLGISVNP